MSSTPTSAPSKWAFDEKGFLQKIPYPVIPTNLKGVYASTAPPDDFDPNTASAAELIKNGILWPRPAATDHPALHEMWQKVFSRKRLAKDCILSGDEPQVGRTHILRKQPRKVGDTDYVNGNWSGAGTFKNGPYAGIIGSWLVPTVSKPSEPPSGYGSWDYSHGILYDSSSWVGIDGWDLTTFLSNDVLQAGIEQYIDDSGTPNYVAWYEWYVPYGPPPSYVNQTNIPVPVSPGDQICVVVQYMSKTAGFIDLINLTTGKWFSRTLQPPLGATFSGNTVEWIMECPDGGEDSGTSLAKFTPVKFTFAQAFNASGADVNNPKNDDTCDIQSGWDGKILTKVTRGDYSVTIDYSPHS
jgi:hypothetical protein